MGGRSVGRNCVVPAFSSSVCLGGGLLAAATEGGGVGSSIGSTIVRRKNAELSRAEAGGAAEEGVFALSIGSAEVRRNLDEAADS
jgi:hypothetical protein